MFALVHMPRRLRSDAGFTLAELLATILIIGILAGLALPTFLRYGNRSGDAVAKAAARDVVSLMQACFAERQDFRRCNPPDDVGAPGVAFGAGAGQVAVVDVDRETYLVRATSRTTTHGVHHWYSIARGTVTRDCAPHGRDGCRGDDETGADGNRW
jgi:prepilin-type N-terminal cleavage/methylation domain-containing protein